MSLIFVEENGRYPTFDYLDRLRNSWPAIGTNEAVALIGELADIEMNGPRGQNETIDGVTLYFAMSGPHLIAHAPNPVAQDEILVSTIFHMRNFAAGRDEAWRLLKTVVIP